MGAMAATVPLLKHPRARTAWFVLAILLAFSIAAPLNQFKVSPILPILLQAFNITVGRSGLIMSVYAMTGLILALPAGFILQKLGIRATGLLAGTSIIIGTVLGATSTGLDGLLVSRVIEGVGTSFMAVLAPTVIAIWFTANRRGTAMGIWSSWVPIGVTGMMVVAPILAQGGSWQIVWWFGVAYALVTLALFLFIARNPPAKVLPITPQTVNATPQTRPSVNMLSLLRKPNVWLIGLAFGCFVMSSSSISGFMPTYLNTVFGLPLSQAALIPSINSIITIFSCPVGGMISDRLGTRRKLFVPGILIVAILIPLMGISSLPMLVVLIVMQGIVTGLVPTNIFSAGVEAAGDDRLSGMAMGVIMVGQNAGSLLGPLLFSGLVESASWPIAFGSLGIVCVAGAAAGWLSKAR